jgi:hypothetical protein
MDKGSEEELAVTGAPSGTSQKSDLACRTHGHAYVACCPDCDATLFLALFVSAREGVT